MIAHKFRFTFLIVVSLLLSGYNTLENTNDLQGIWVRVTDQLKISVKEDTPQRLNSFIVDEGKEKFPCAVADLPIYKNIVHVRGNLWSCDFLVVTMGSCSTGYEQGIIRLTDQDHMEINCPGFGKKTYAKQKPRYAP